MMDFGSLPPEVNSARMFAGPGSASMTAAATAWSQVSAELTASATGCQTTIDTLISDGWIGPSAAMMSATATPYVQWLQALAEQAEQSAAGARAVATAFDTAFAATVPPAEIATNRAQLAQLVAGNIVGQNTAAIAALEALYGQMWTQDAAAMYQYAAGCAAASRLPQFTTPPQTTNADGVGAQQAAVARAAHSAAGQSQDTLSRLVSEVPSALNKLASPGAGASASNPLDILAHLPNPYVPSDAISDVASLPFFAAGIAGFFSMAAKSLGLLNSTAVVPSVLANATSGSATAAAGGTPMLVGMRESNMVGRLSVPAAWPGAMPPVSGPPTAQFVSDVVEYSDHAPAGSVIGGLPMTGSNRSSGPAGPRYGARVTVIARPPAAG